MTQQGENSKHTHTLISYMETPEGDDNSLPSLPPSIRAAAELIYDYMRVGHTPSPADVILALGSNDERVAERAADLYHLGLAPLLVFSGGVGALTRGLWSCSEAAHFADVAAARGVPRSAMAVEGESTNTGENARFSRSLLALRGVHPASLIVVQKPFMERRTLATLQAQWGAPLPHFCVTSPQLPLARYPNPRVPRLALSDVLETMCGDLQRIAVYPARGFQVYQEIPLVVWEALRFLVREGVSGPQLMLVEGARAGSREPGDYIGLGEAAPPPPPIPLRFHPARAAATRRPDVSWSESCLPHGGSVRVRGVSSGGWVFCGVQEGGCGEHMVAEGGNVVGVRGLSNDESECEVVVTHDGRAEEVVVTFNTRAD